MYVLFDLIIAEKKLSGNEIWQKFGHINKTLNWIRHITLDSADFVELNTKIRPKFGVDLYG